MCNKCINAINYYLDEKSRKFDTPQQKLAYEHGFLSSLLASIIHDDVFVQHKVMKKLKPKPKK